MCFLKKVFLILFFCLPVIVAKSQPDSSCRIRISLLTCSPGEDLYSIWGHTGIRLIDSAKDADVVFNYGTFDDSDPLFYVKFTRGIMTYSLSVWSFTDFMREYQYERRGVTEQVLQLTCEAKKRLTDALIQNAQEPNRYYGYHFYQDNCTTRARDIIAKNAGGTVSFKNILQGEPTFRNLIHDYLNKGGQYWSKLGIDILLGSALDKKADNDQAMFLPDYLMNAFDSASIDNRVLLESRNVILEAAARKESRSIFTPLNVFIALLVIIVALSFSKTKPALRFMKIFDITFFLFLGLIGILILVLWIIRVDTVCRNNFNILLMLPTHAFMVFFLNKKSKWVNNYWMATFFLALLFFILIFIGKPQQLNNALLPVVVIVLARIRSRFTFKTGIRG